MRMKKQFSHVRLPTRISNFTSIFNKIVILKNNLVAFLIQYKQQHIQIVGLYKKFEQLLIYPFVFK